MPSICREDNCTSPTVGRGLCQKHYNAWYRQNKLTAEKRREYQATWRANRHPDDVLADKDKKREYNRLRQPRARELMKRRERENRAYITEIKLERGCEWCGKDNLEPYRLHFHHLDDETKVKPVSKMVGGSREALDAEIAKCVVICGSCHATHHYREKIA